MPRSRHIRGQAAVEFAIISTLILFLILGILQLSLIQHARALTQYAAFNAVRAGAVSYGDCTRMSHAAALSLMPAVDVFIGRGGPPANALAAAFSARYQPPTTFKYTGTDRDDFHDEDIFWIRREQPLIGAVQALANDQNDEFDDPQLTQPDFRLEAEVVFWYPMKIPFASWLISRMMLAHWGIMSYVSRDAIVNNSQTVDYGEGGAAPPFDSNIVAELQTRVAAKHYVFPLRASYTMRMMTPAKKRFFQVQNCPPAPP